MTDPPTYRYSFSYIVDCAICGQPFAGLNYADTNRDIAEPIRNPICLACQNKHPHHRSDTL